ncbi:MAG: Rrf2 family transcriptional regulator [bacterium]|jgi:Rrf2 family protein
MSEMLKISEAANLAMHGMVLLAARDGKAVSTREMAQLMHVSEAHLSKVMQRLAKEGFVNSVRGPNGGFSLGYPAEDITLLEVYEAVEGPLESKRCLLGVQLCDGKQCVLGNLMSRADALIREELAKSRLSEAAGSLKKLLRKK